MFNSYPYVRVRVSLGAVLERVKDEK